MSTTDVPGAKATNYDKLATGCWAEHDDGSLVFVEGLEGGDVIYSLFDISKNPVVEYRDAMPLKGFEFRFSWPNNDKLKWTWHDKTTFPWTRVMHHFPAGTRHASAGGTISAAEILSERLNLRAQEVRERAVTQPGARSMMKRLADAILRD